MKRELKEQEKRIIPSKFSHLDVRKHWLVQQQTSLDLELWYHFPMSLWKIWVLKKYSVLDIFKIEAFQIFNIVIVLKCEPFFIKPYQLYQSLQKKSAFNKYFHTAIWVDECCDVIYTWSAGAGVLEEPALVPHSAIPRHPQQKFVIKGL